jgi:uncharacterized protein with FMN-binding domain
VRRIATVAIATVGGLALLAAFHTTPGLAPKSAAGVLAPARPPAGAAPPSVPATTVSPSSGSSAASPAPTTPPTARPASRTFAGPVVSNRYGDVQVEVVVSGKQLVDVEAIELPMDRQHSVEISSVAGPELRQEALQAKSANIDAISGATYTSESYAQSLQAALDQAGL